jgi:hypothetical protein
MPKKNTKGGKGFKSFARKNISYTHNTVLPSDPLEKIARVIRFFGNMCQIITQDEDGKIYNCHIRGKFKGRSKRSCIISVGKYVLVGFRHFESPVFKNCDLLEVYDETTDIPILKSIYDLSFLNNYLNHLFGHHDNILINSFDTETINDTDDFQNTNTITNTNTNNQILYIQHDFINIHDI